MASKKDIPTLIEFRNLVDKYLFVGYAPVTDYTWQPSQGLIDMEKALETPEMLELRRRINELKPTIKQILSECGMNPIMKQYPPPLIGGPVLNAHLFDLITENKMRRSIKKSEFFDFIDQAIGYLKTVEDDTTKPTVKLATETKKGFVFIAMPIDQSKPELEDVLDSIKTAALELSLVAERVDEPEFNERITDRIIDSINRAEFVVCDLTNSKQNVYYEAGYAHGIGKIPIFIARLGTNVEFDLKDYPVIFFQNLKELKDKLKKRLLALSSRH